jgi:hypothetical protein
MTDNTKKRKLKFIRTKNMLRVGDIQPVVNLPEVTEEGYRRLINRWNKEFKLNFRIVEIIENKIRIKHFCPKYNN